MTIKEDIKKIFELITQDRKERNAMNIKLENHLTAHKVKWQVIRGFLWSLGIIATILGVCFTAVKLLK